LRRTLVLATLHAATKPADINILSQSMNNSYSKITLFLKFIYINNPVISEVMKLSFIKTIEGHEVEFVRLMYPLRYNIFIRLVNSKPLKLTMKKEGEGIWEIVECDKLLGPVAELTMAIQEAIEENEADVIDK
jgi:hypothetical protein